MMHDAVYLCGGDMVEVLGIGEMMIQMEPVHPRQGLEGCHKLGVRVAGAEGNVCVTASRLGLASALCTGVGRDPFGTRIRAFLETNEVDVGWLETVEGHPTGVFFKEQALDDRRSVYYYRKGSAASTLSAEMLLAALEGASPAAVVTSGITLALSHSLRQGLFAVAEALANSDQVFVLDPNLRPQFTSSRLLRDLKDLARRADFLVGGVDEAALMLDVPRDPKAVAEMATKLGVREVVLKDGARGCFYQGPEGMVRQPAVDVPVIDTVGAGDGFLGGYLAARLRGAEMAEAAEVGSRVGAMIVSSRGDTEGVPWVRHPTDVLGLPAGGSSG